MYTNDSPQLNGLSVQIVTILLHTRSTDSSSLDLLTNFVCCLQNVHYLLFIVVDVIAFLYVFCYDWYLLMLRSLLCTVLQYRPHCLSYLTLSVPFWNIFILDNIIPSCKWCCSYICSCHVYDDDGVIYMYLVFLIV